MANKIILIFNLYLLPTVNYTILKRILPLFSYLFHPIFISMYAALFYFFYKGEAFSEQEKIYILFQIALVTFVVPVLFFLFLRSTGNVKSVMLPEIAQRRIPLLLQCFLFILLAKRSVLLFRYPELHFFFLGGLFSAILALIISIFKIKASLHMMAMSGLTVFIIGLNMHLELYNPFWVAFLMLITGVVGSSRLEMNAHTYKELLIGLILGGLPQLLFMYLWL